MSNVVVQPTWKVLEISWNVKKCNRLQSVLEVASSRCYNVASRASWFWNLQWNGLPADTDWKHINLGSNANHQDKFIWIHVPQILFEFLVLKNKHLNIFASSGYFVLEIQETDGHSHMGSAPGLPPLIHQNIRNPSENLPPNVIFPSSSSDCTEWWTWRPADGPSHALPTLEICLQKVSCGTEQERLCNVCSRHQLPRSRNLWFYPNTYMFHNTIFPRVESCQQKNFPVALKCPVSVPRVKKGSLSDKQWKNI